MTTPQDPIPLIDKKTMEEKWKAATKEIIPSKSIDEELDEMDQGLDCQDGTAMFRDNRKKKKEEKKSLDGRERQLE